MDWIFLFLVTVWKMRQAQKAYFTKGRKINDLVDAKRYEKLVDEELIKRLVFAGDVPTGISRVTKLLCLPMSQRKKNYLMENDNETTKDQ